MPGQARAWRKWWNRNGAFIALGIAFLSLLVSGWSSYSSEKTASESNTIQAQLRDLTARVDLNLMSVKSDYVKGQKSSIVNFTIQLNNAGPGVASQVTFGIGTASGDPAGRAIAVNGLLDGTIAYPYPALSDSLPVISDFIPPTDDPTKLVTVWVRYADALNRHFQVEYGPDPRFKWQQACNLFDCVKTK